MGSNGQLTAHFNNSGISSRFRGLKRIKQTNVVTFVGTLKTSAPLAFFKANPRDFLVPLVLNLRAVPQVFDAIVVDVTVYVVNMPIRIDAAVMPQPNDAA
jgi:hypothetical protein